MAHRQSYKEEPGVAVAGDHVSTQLFFLSLFQLTAVTKLSDAIIVLVLVLCSATTYLYGEHEHLFL